MNSIPAESAICATALLFSQLASQRSGIVVAAKPDEQFEANTPSFSLFGPRSVLGLPIMEAPLIFQS
jgi:hypothetical protein